MRILVTAGPTREMIDPVRFISNLSTGLMGYELAREARRKGHRVTLISGPTALTPPRGVTFLPVITGKEMRRLVVREARRSDVLVMTAAVGDYVPTRVFRGKLRRNKNHLRLILKKTPDILAEVGRARKKPILVGFSLETSKLKEHSEAKLKRKHLDFIVANAYSGAYSPFGEGRKKALVLDKNGRVYSFTHKTKRELARTILSLSVAAHTKRRLGTSSR